MSKYSSVVFASLVFVFGLSACNPPASQKRTSAVKGKSVATQSELIAATFDKQTLTLRDIDAELGESLYEARKHTATRMAFEAILNEKAEKQGLTSEELMKKEMDARVQPPTEAEMMAVFESSRGQLPPEVTFERVRGDIENFLRSQTAQRVMPEIQEAWLKEANFQFVLPYEHKRVAIEAIGPSKGPDNAPVTIVEFSDFGCSFCRRGAETMSEILKAYPDKVKVHFRHFAMMASKASEAAMCAHEQGKFWEYHEVLFANQGRFEPENLKEHAKALGLDEEAFSKCLDSEKHVETVKRDVEAGRKAGVRGTPAFFINGILLSGAQPLEKFKELIDSELQAQ